MSKDKWSVEDRLQRLSKPGSRVSIEVWAKRDASAGKVVIVAELAPNEMERVLDPSFITMLAGMADALNGALGGKVETD